MIEQLSIWENVKPYFKLDKPIRLIELFAGIGSQHQALKNLGLEINRSTICEWSIQSTQAYNDIHVQDYTDYSKGKSKDELIAILSGLGVSSDYNQPMTAEQLKRKGEAQLRTIYNNIIATHNLVNIMSAKGDDLNIAETDKYIYIMTYSFPCFPADTLVLTKDGNKRIEEVKIGDLVLTHTNQWQVVSNFFAQGIKPIYKINGMAFHELKATGNHKFLTREMYRKWDNDKRTYERHFNDPIWKEAQDLTKKDYLGISIIQDEVMPKWSADIIKNIIHTEDFWYVMGRYVADGWKRTQGGIVIAANAKKTTSLTNALERLNINYCIAKGKSNNNIHIPRVALGLFVNQFGYYAPYKHLSKMVMLLPKPLLKSFLDGYIYGDGCVIGKVIKVSSTSERLIYDVAQCVAKVYQTPYKIYQTKRQSFTIIENRIVNQRDDYQLVFKKEKNKQDKAFYENGYVWFPINSIEESGESCVYDIQVDNDHSFMANGTIAHNCQDLSLAGKQGGMARGSGTRSGLLWEVERLLKETKNLPQILLMENVPDVIGTNNIKHFQEWEMWLASLGYSNHCEILNAKDYGIPQNRDRCFMISILGDYLYRFPQKQELKLRLKDMLESEVDEKYYLSQSLISRISNWKSQQNPLDHIYTPDETAPTITARGAGEERSGMVLVSNEVEQVAQMYGDGKENNPQAGRIYNADGLCPTMDTMMGGNRMPKILFKSKDKRLPEMLDKIDFESKEPQSLDLYNRTVGDISQAITLPNHNSQAIAIKTWNDDTKALKTKDKDMPRDTLYFDDSVGFTITTIENQQPYILERFYKNREPREYVDAAPIIRANRSGLEVAYNLRIRKLTPKECWRLMGFKDEQFDLAQQHQSNSTLYHQAGDSIVVNVLEAIFQQLKGEANKCINTDKTERD